MSLVKQNGDHTPTLQIPQYNLYPSVDLNIDKIVAPDILGINFPLLQHVDEAYKNSVLDAISSFHKQYLCGETKMDDQSGHEYTLVDDLTAGLAPKEMLENLPLFKKETTITAKIVPVAIGETIQGHRHLQAKTIPSIVIIPAEGESYLYGSDEQPAHEMIQEFQTLHRETDTKGQYQTIKPPLQGFFLDKNIIYRGEKYHTGDFLSFQHNGDCYPMKRERFETDYIYTNVPHVFYDSTLAFRTPSMLEETAMAIHFSHLSQHRKTENLNDDYMAELNNKYLAMSIASLFAADTAATVAIGKEKKGKALARSYIDVLQRSLNGTLSIKEQMIFSLCSHAAYESTLAFQGFTVLQEKEGNIGLLNLDNKGLSQAFNSVQTASPHLAKLSGKELDHSDSNRGENGNITVSSQLSNFIKKINQDERTIRAIIDSESDDTVMLAKNIAGIRGAILAASLLALDDEGNITDESFLNAANKILKGDLTSEEDFIIRNAAHLTWQSSQAPESLARLKRPVNMQAFLLEHPNLKHEQIKDTEHVIKNLEKVMELWKSRESI